jgi:hypothetical protein
MPLLFINAVDCLAFSLFLYLFVTLRDHRRRRGLPYPPGPPARPIIGNLLDVPMKSPWTVYTGMSKKYGTGYQFCDSPSHELSFLFKVMSFVSVFLAKT